MNNILELTDEQLRELFEKKVRLLKDQLHKAELALAAYTTTPNNVSKIVDRLDELENGSNLFKSNTSIVKGKNYTLSDKAEHVLSVEQCPLSSRELLDLINNTFKDKEYSFDKFSGQWSILYRKTTKNFDKVNFDKNSPPLRQLYVLKDWKKGENLLPKYREALIHKHQGELFE